MRRTARWRDRRSRGFRISLVCTADIDRLVARGLMEPQQRDDPIAVEAAIGLLLDRLGR